MLGKVPPDELAALVLGRTGATDDRVLQGPAYGEDAGVVELGDEALVVSPDPVSMAVGRVGRLGVDVACNDVAAAGGDPAWLTNVLLLPDDDEDVLDDVTRQVDRAGDRLGVAVVAGHSEYVPALDRPMLVLTCLGPADRYVPTGGADPGDAVVLTKRAAVEGTAILATDFQELLGEAVPAPVLDRAAGFYDEVSVVPEATVLRAYASAMHDPTEGGLVDGFLEVATASGVALDVDPDATPVADETRALCEAAGVDPFRIFGSGALVATVPDAEVEAAMAALRNEGIEATVVGTVRAADEPELRLGEAVHRDPVRDDMYDLWE
jgi:hydrogenase expression/formation protein HypE